MIFSSTIFIFVFLVAVLAIYYLLPRFFRNLWLFLCSLYFYYYGEPAYLILMLVSITVNYISGLLIGKFSDRVPIKRLILVLNIAVNLGLLGYFKYAGFAAELVGKLPFFSDIKIAEIALPVGISFYTFQTMSYTIDVYRGNCAPQKNYIAFGTYVSLFPQLIAGPIVRYVDIEDQLRNRRESMEKFERGVKLFVVGLCKKVLLANSLGVLWDDFSSGSGTLGSWAAIIGFTLQIYFDFSGYSDMARGLGNMLGFEFVENFRYPYLADSITDFWRRWHISLGSWFREYVYIPLGGNRCSRARHIFNLLVTWMLTGLWHGASMNFVLWGLYFGIILIIEKLVLGKVLKKTPKFIKHIYALFLIVMGWVLFNFTDTAQMFAFIGRLFGTAGFADAAAVGELVTWLPTLAVAVFAALPVGAELWRKLDGKAIKPVLDAALVLIALVLCTASLISSSYNPFLYFRF
ncbi:MAG: MBOAT family O-acyltransferase [Eubacteriales bacterium]